MLTPVYYFQHCSAQSHRVRGPYKVNARLLDNPFRQIFVEFLSLMSTDIRNCLATGLVYVFGSIEFYVEKENPTKTAR